jgi:chorismate synthase
VYIKDAVFVPPFTTDLPELAGSIRDAVATVTLNLFNNVWTEIEYRYDICLAIHGVPIEHL